MRKFWKKSRPKRMTVRDLIRKAKKGDTEFEGEIPSATLRVGPKQNKGILRGINKFP